MRTYTCAPSGYLRVHKCDRDPIPEVRGGRTCKGFVLVNLPIVHTHITLHAASALHHLWIAQGVAIEFPDALSNKGNLSIAQFLLILHLLGVVVWLGGSIAIGGLWLKSSSTGDTELLGATKDLSWMSKRLAMPASIVVLLAAGGLVSAANFDFNQVWIHLGTGLLILAALIGIVVIGPNTKRLFSSLQAGSRDLVAVNRVRFGLISVQLMLLVAIWAMVAKPF